MNSFLQILNVRIVKSAGLLLLMISTACNPNPPKKIWLDELDLSKADQAAGSSIARKSMWNTPLIIAGDTFQRGVGTHASGMIKIDLNSGSRKFHAMVGLDDSPPEHEKKMASVEFIVFADQKKIWESGIMKSGEKAKSIDLNLKGVKTLLLYTDAGDDGISGDRVNWADSWFEVTGAAPVTFKRIAEAEYILTPETQANPKINAPYIYAARPGNPILITLPISGAKPMSVNIENLPTGLKADIAKGIIYGSVVKPGNYDIAVTAENSFGKDTRNLQISIGEIIAPTPPMGWNSWNAFGSDITQEKVKAAATAMVNSGLINFGYSYINIDDGWQGERGGKYNAIMPNGKFPDMKGLVEYIHSLGLKAGIYSSPWVTTYAGFTGGSADTRKGMINSKERRFGKFAFEKEDIKQFAEWGFDYIKYDWNPNDIEHTKQMSYALRNSGRDIVFSISNAAPFEHAEQWAKLTNLWRTTFDIHDSWYSLTSIGFSQNTWQPFAGPGHWNDPDMLILGMLGWGNTLHNTRLSPNEQYLHITLWSILAAPLFIGCDMTKLDKFTLNLLSNREVLEVNQDIAGIQGRRVFSDKAKQVEVWIRPLSDGAFALGLFNLSEQPQEISVKWKDFGIEEKLFVRDLWQQKNLGIFEESFTSIVPDHAAVFVKLLPIEK